MAEHLSENTIAVLKVLRQSEQGAFLDGQTGNTSDDILLHRDQQTEPVAIGDEVTVFLYHDPKGRLTASMRLPAFKVGQIAYTSVINTTTFGCFVDAGTERGIFMPHAEMRGRPQVGEKVWVRLYEDKSGRLAVSMDVDDAMRRASKPAKDVKVGQEVRGAVYNITGDGAFFITPERWIAFLHRSEMQNSVKVGEMIKARVTFVRDDGRINVSRRLVKEEAIQTDSEAILAYLEQRNGRMPYTDASSAMIIKDKFNLSKAAFKRALGHLMKQRLIQQEEGWTTATEKAAGWLAAKAAERLAAKAAADQEAADQKAVAKEAADQKAVAQETTDQKREELHAQNKEQDKGQES